MMAIHSVLVFESDHDPFVDDRMIVASGASLLKFTEPNARRTLDLRPVFQHATLEVRLVPTFENDLFFEDGRLYCHGLDN